MAVPLLDLAWKSLLLVALARLTLLGMSRLPAAARCLLLRATVTGLLVVPLCCTVLPPLAVPVLPRSIPGQAPVRISGADGDRLAAPGVSMHRAMPEMAAATPPLEPRHRTGWSWTGLLSGAWLAGAALLGARLAAAIRQARRFAAGCRPAERVLDAALAEARGALGIPPDVRLALGRAGGPPRVPMTLGYRRAVILLPGEAVEWGEEQRRTVLLHELGHIRRADWLWRLAAETACALYWFNPLVWRLSARLQAESEAACDDLVLLAGVPPSTYATVLLQVARSFTPAGKEPQCSVGMAHGRGTASRIRAVLSANAGRRHCTPRERANLLLTCALLSVLVGAARLTAMPRPADPARRTADAAARTAFERPTPGALSGSDGALPAARNRDMPRRRSHVNILAEDGRRQSPERGGSVDSAPSPTAPGAIPGAAAPDDSSQRIGERKVPMVKRSALILGMAAALGAAGVDAAQDAAAPPPPAPAKEATAAPPPPPPASPAPPTAPPATPAPPKEPAIDAPPAPGAPAAPPLPAQPGDVAGAAAPAPPALPATPAEPALRARRRATRQGDYLRPTRPRTERARPAPPRQVAPGEAPDPAPLTRRAPRFQPGTPAPPMQVVPGEAPRLRRGRPAPAAPAAEAHPQLANQQVLVKTLKHAKAERVAETLRKHFERSGGTAVHVAVDSRTNTVIIVGRAVDVAAADAMIRD